MLAIEDIAMKPKSNPEQEQEQDSTKKKKRKRRRGSSKPETKTSALLELLTAALYECKASTARTENLLQEMRAEFQDALNPERRKVSECHACAKRKKRRARKQD